MENLTECDICACHSGGWEEIITLRYRYAKCYLALTDRHLGIQLLYIGSYNRARIMLRLMFIHAFMANVFSSVSLSMTGMI